MADLDPLIRYRKHQLEEKQKFLAKLYAEGDKLLAARKEVLAQMEKEKSVINSGELQNFPAMQGFGRFLEAAKAKLKDIEKQEKLLDTRIQIAVEDMRDSFGEMKKIEITQARRLEEERKELEAKEDAIFEEIGLQQYSKNQE